MNLAEPIQQKIYDLLVIGGGINGVGIALDLQGRGLSTALVEKNDLASATSSASSKLIHGGLRYLEHYEFRLVKKGLNEREVLLHKAPHLVKPLRFVLPHLKHLRPSWVIRAGLLLYDFLARRDTLPRSRRVKFNPATSPLKATISQGFEYSDCWVDDARLVVLNAVQCQQLGGDVRTYTECVGASFHRGLWHIALRDTLQGETYTLKARGLVNAAGPWVESLFSQQLARPSPHKIQLIKGSHIVVRQLYEGDYAHILQHQDGRIVFVIPYLDRYSLIGTTDVKHTDAPDKVAISAQEIAYLCDIVNQNFTGQISADDIIWSYSGVRALCGDESDSPQALTRDYTIVVEEDSGAPLLSVFGGKLTTYRKLSEAVAEKLQPYYPTMGAAWTKTALLPGGDMGMEVQQYIQHLSQSYPFLTAATAKRMALSYGSRAIHFLKNATTAAELGEDFGEQFSAAELDYLIRSEFVRTAEDALWRRSKMGLLLSKAQQVLIADYINAYSKNTFSNVTEAQ